MRTPLILVLVLVLVWVGTGLGSLTHDQLLSVTPSSLEQVEQLKNISSQHQTSLWKPVSSEFITENNPVHLFVVANSSVEVKRKLTELRILHHVLLSNAEELVQLQTRNSSTDPRSSSSFYERYHTLEDIYLWINRTSLEHSASIKVLLLGSSYEKRPIYALKLSVSSAPGRKALWLDCGIHAREWISPAFCLWFVQYSLGFHGQNSEITQILDHFDVYVLPVLNPDGYLYTWTTNRMWRKNRSPSLNRRCVGVDLNRNFDANWCTEGASSSPCSEIYCGSFPESEPESQAVAQFLRTHKDQVQVYISIHSYSQMLLFPYSCSAEPAKDHNELLEMVQEASQKIRRHYRNNYRYGSGSQTIYLAPGGSDDWAYNLGIKYAFTFELQDTGKFGFLLPPSHINKACNEALLALKTIAMKVIHKTRSEAGLDQV